MIYLAGMYRYEEKQPLPMFTMLIRPAVTELQHIHDRMPVILPRDMAMAWLEPGADVQGLMKQADGDHVSIIMNLCVASLIVGYCTMIQMKLSLQQNTESHGILNDLHGYTDSYSKNDLLK